MFGYGKKDETPVEEKTSTTSYFFEKEKKNLENGDLDDLYKEADMVCRSNQGREDECKINSDFEKEAVNQMIDEDFIVKHFADVYKHLYVEDIQMTGEGNGGTSQLFSCGIEKSGEELKVTCDMPRASKSPAPAKRRAKSPANKKKDDEPLQNPVAHQPNASDEQLKKLQSMYLREDFNSFFKKTIEFNKKLSEFHFTTARGGMSKECHELAQCVIQKLMIETENNLHIQKLQEKIDESLKACRDKFPKDERCNSLATLLKEFHSTTDSFFDTFKSISKSGHIVKDTIVNVFNNISNYLKATVFVFAVLLICHWQYYQQKELLSKRIDDFKNTTHLKFANITKDIPFTYDNVPFLTDSKVETLTTWLAKKDPDPYSSQWNISFPNIAMISVNESPVLHIRTTHDEIKEKMKEHVEKKIKQRIDTNLINLESYFLGILESFYQSLNDDAYVQMHKSALHKLIFDTNPYNPENAGNIQREVSVPENIKELENYIFSDQNLLVKPESAVTKIQNEMSKGNGSEKFEALKNLLTSITSRPSTYGICGDFLLHIVKERVLPDIDEFVDKINPYYVAISGENMYKMSIMELMISSVNTQDEKLRFDLHHYMFQRFMYKDMEDTKLFDLDMKLYNDLKQELNKNIHYTECKKTGNAKNQNLDLQKMMGSVMCWFTQSYYNYDDRETLLDLAGSGMFKLETGKKGDGLFSGGTLWPSTQRLLDGEFSCSA